MLVDGEDGDLQDGHYEKLHRAGFTKNSTKGNQDRRSAEVCVDHSAGDEAKKGTKNSTHICCTLKSTVRDAQQLKALI